MESPLPAKGLWETSVWNIQQERNPYFVGRDEQLAAIKRGFDEAKNSHPVQALVGMGGSGKTSLALEYAHSRKMKYELIWFIHAENQVRMAADMAALAQRLDPHADDGDLQLACRRALRELERREEWLLIFDNAQFPTDLASYIPWSGSGHVLITSRNMEWKPMADTILIQPWKRDESIAFLSRRLKNFKDRSLANQLATALGDLPLALEQACACIEQTRTSPQNYLRQFENYWGELLTRGATATERPNFAAMAWELSFRQIEAIDPVASDLLTLCSLLGPDEIPLRLFRDGSMLLPQSLSDAAGIDLSGLRGPMATLRQFSLAQSDEKAISVHRVIAGLVRQRLGDQELMKWATIAVNLASQAFPYDSQNHETWAQCTESLPHALAATEYARDGHAPAKAVIDLLDRSGRFMLKIGQAATARDTLEKALTMVKATYGERSPRTADIANNLGRAKHRLGDFSDAMGLFESAMQIDGMLYGANDPHMATVANNFGMSLAAMGEPARARERFEKALKVYETHYGQDHLKVGSVLNNLGYVQMQLGDLAGARSSLQRALGIAESSFGPNHPNVACILANLAGVLKLHGLMDEAGHLYSRAMAIDERALGPNSPALARDLGKMGQFLLERGNLAGAVQHLDRCVRICESQLGENHPTTVNRLNDLGKAFTAAGNAQRAAECFVKANERSRKRDSAPAPLQPMSSTSLDFEDMDMQLKPESEVWGE